MFAWIRSKSRGLGGWRRNRLGRLAKEERGSTIVLGALMLVLLLVTAGLAIDGGTLYVTKRQLQKTADAAVLSGGQELVNAQSNVESVVQQIVQDSSDGANLADIAVDMTAHTVSATVERMIPFGLSRLMGFSSSLVQAKAAADIEPMGAALGAAPLGIDDSIELDYGKTYSLKVDNTGSVSGYFGILALGGTGAKTYLDNLEHGYSSELDVGTIIDTQTGNVAGDTRSGIQYRINESPYLPGDYSHRDDPRILLVPVYRPYNYSSNQLKQIQITGFAYFYISAPMSSNDTSISGIFIRKTGAGKVRPGASDKGAYVVRLTE